MITRENPFTPIYKICNNGTNTEKYEIIKRGELTVPRYIDVELTNCCNFRCCFCPTGTKSMNRSKGFMPDSVVDAMIENINKYNIPGVRFIRWGEPTLHPKYIEILRRVKEETKAAVHINTNGSLLNEDSMQALVDMGLDSLKFSFQGADEGTYNEMREGGDYLKLLGNIKRINEIRGDKPVPYIQISTTLTGETLDQVESFKKDVDGLCDYYNIGYTKLNHLNVEAMNVSEEEKKKIRALKEQETNSHQYVSVCYEAFDKLSLNWNGDVTLCDNDYDNFLLVGNILDMDLKSIFTSRAADQYRQVIARGEHGNIRCCSYCYEHAPLTK